MLLLDVNVLVYAYKEAAPQHELFRAWLEELVNGDEPFALSDQVSSGFLRIVTHPRVFSPPSLVADALEFVDILRTQPGCIVQNPGARHWGIFSDLCRVARARGNLIPDAYLAALAIETGSELVTTDGDFARFPGVRWRRPL
jgi:toxin-antitoxin system PIN domain toxin